MCIFAGFKHLACPRNRVILSVYDKSFGNLGVILSYRYAIYIHMFFCLISHRYFPKMMVLTPKSSISRRFSTRGTPFMETPFWKSKVSAALDGKPWQLSQVPFRHRCRSGCGTESGLGTLGRQAVSAGNDDLVGGSNGYGVLWVKTLVPVGTLGTLQLSLIGCSSAKWS